MKIIEIAKNLCSTDRPGYTLAGVRATQRLRNAQRGSDIYLGLFYFVMLFAAWGYVTFLLVVS